MKNRVLITGMLRSGTTLLDKILGEIPNSTILSQPFPFFYRQAKKDFYKTIEYSDIKYLLNDYFFEEKHSLNDVTDFLDKYNISKEVILEVLDKMKGYSGQYFDTSNITDKPIADSYEFIEMFEFFLDSVGNYSQDALQGFKEVQCEEFIPSFMDKGWKAIIIIRNPYDVISSIQFGKGNQYTGKRRPTLFHLRNWRKSADMAILYKNNPQFHVLKYEDLLLNPNQTLGRIFDFLEITNNVSIDYIINTQLNKWQGNSSFNQKEGGLNKDALYRYKKILPVEMVDYISKLCEPELKYYGYDVYNSKDFKLVNYKEPFNIEQEDFVDKKDFSSSIKNVAQEIQRIRMLKNDNELNTDIRAAFIDTYIYKELKRIDSIL